MLALTEAFYTAVFVALIGGPLMFGLRKFDKRNTDQHAENQVVLQEIRSEVGDIRKSQLEHLEWHVENPIPHTPTLKVVQK